MEPNLHSSIYCTR